MINATAKILQGDIWISRTVLENILLKDMANIEDKNIKHYILQLIERFNKIQINNKYEL